MKLSKQLATNLQQVYFGGNWTEVNLKDTLSDVSWENAIKKTDGFNSILALTFHIHYFTKVQLNVLEHGILDGKDSESYNHPNISSQTEWEAFKQDIWEDAQRYVGLIEVCSDTLLNEAFTDDKYGTYLSNILDLLEHTHYHLGQISLIKKMNMRP